MIPLMKNAFTEEYETKQALAEFILKAPRLSMDRMCFSFEREFAATQGRRFAVLFNSGGSANLALLQALRNLGRLDVGDAVGFSALTWSTNVMPILQMGMQPVPVDCDPACINTTAQTLRQRLGQEPIKAFFITNALGFAGDLDAIRQLCDERGVLLLEDNCESLGTELHSGRTGNFGLASTFSFFVAHHMSTIEGGMAVTDDEELAEMLTIVRANGWDRNLTARQQHKWRQAHGVRNEFDAKYTFYDLGYNLRPTEITGFLGLCQLKHLERIVTSREHNYLTLEAAARENTELITIERGHIKRLSNFSYPVLCRTPAAREESFRQFSGAGVEIRPMIAGNIQAQPFFTKYVDRRWSLPGTEFIHDCGFYFGNYPELTESDLEVLSGCLRGL
jgi:CDP-6-deoxy-D-xylo-4-hexulose-3-dehydrase